MANESLPGEQPGQLTALLERWQTSLDLHARYAALDDARYWHVQPWPRHERPQRWIIQLARKRILALKRNVEQRLAEGDRAFIEGVETMGFLATLVGLTSVDRYIPLATHETERREVLAAKPEAEAGEEKEVSDTARSRRTAETTRQMPALPSAARAPAAQAQRAPTAQPQRAPSAQPQRAPTAQRPAQAKPAAPAPQPRREVRREAPRPATVKPKKAPSTITQAEHVVIADAVRLLGWGRQWHELADMISRLAERPAPSEIRRILRTYREHIDAIATRRRD